MKDLQGLILNPETIPQVDLEFMNHTHLEEVEMVKVLGQSILAYQTSGQQTSNEINQITQLLDNWLRHTQDHFARENTLMLDIQFPAYPVHSNEHERAQQEMIGVMKKWKKNNDIDLLAEYVFNAWPNWFEAHVNSMDMMTARFAVMQGYQVDSWPPQRDTKA